MWRSRAASLRRLVPARRLGRGLSRAAGIADQISASERDAARRSGAAHGMECARRRRLFDPGRRRRRGSLGGDNARGRPRAALPQTASGRGPARAGHSRHAPRLGCARSRPSTAPALRSPSAGRARARHREFISARRDSSAPCSTQNRHCRLSRLANSLSALKMLVLVSRLYYKRAPPPPNTASEWGEYDRLRTKQRAAEHQ